MSKVHTHYLPGMGRHWLLPLYDPFTLLMGAESAHLRLTDQAGLRPDQRVLEIGCGTGNLTLLAKRLQPAAELTGLDPDPQALARARRKATSRRLSVAFDEGFAGALPYADGHFDRVLSSLMYHHLRDADEKRQALAEVARVLKPGGSLHLVDFVEDVDAAMREAGLADAYLVGTARSRLGLRYRYYGAHR